jgi:hypothetical protein
MKRSRKEGYVKYKACRRQNSYANNNIVRRKEIYNFVRFRECKENSQDHKMWDVCIKVEVQRGCSDVCGLFPKVLNLRPKISLIETRSENIFDQKTKTLHVDASSIERSPSPLRSLSSPDGRGMELEYILGSIERRRCR